MLTPDSDEIKALDAELSRMRTDIAQDRSHLRELKWMLRIAAFLFVPLVILAWANFERDMSIRATTYVASVAVGISGWGIYRTLCFLRGSRNRYLYIPALIAFCCALFFYFCILMQAREGHWRFEFGVRSNSPFRKK
ncbi:MAG: hypothetical protein WCT04_13360 [Planctomycetota bacterium]